MFLFYPGLYFIYNSTSIYHKIKPKKEKRKKKEEKDIRLTSKSSQSSCTFSSILVMGSFRPAISLHLFPTSSRHGSLSKNTEDAGDEKRVSADSKEGKEGKGGGTK